MAREREGMADDPFWFVWSLVKTERSPSPPCAKYVSAMLESDRSFSSQALSELHNRVKESSSAMRMVTYCEINPYLEGFPMYWSRKEIKEFHRVAVTRIRLSFHRLAIETGRWSRLPFEESMRKCTRGEIQTGSHVVNECVRTRDVTLMYDGPGMIVCQATRCFFMNLIC